MQILSADIIIGLKVTVSKYRIAFHITDICMCGLIFSSNVLQFVLCLHAARSYGRRRGNSFLFAVVHLFLIGLY